VLETGHIHMLVIGLRELGVGGWGKMNTDYARNANTLSSAVDSNLE
jgi:hypothetical protein